MISEIVQVYGKSKRTYCPFHTFHHFVVLLNPLVEGGKVVAVAVMSVVLSAGGHAFCLQAGKRFSISKPKGHKFGPRAALVEATPRVNGSPSSTSIQVLATDRAEELKAEARALARAADASVYSPQLLAKKYGSRPVKVIIYLSFSS